MPPTHRSRLRPSPDAYKVDDNGAYKFGAAAQRQCKSQCADMDSLQRCRFLENSVALQLGKIAVAPGMVPPSAWLPEVLPEGPREASQLLGLLLRLYNDVLKAVQRRRPLLPEVDDIEGCRAFAAGYAAGAALDPLWIGDKDRWTFAVPFAYLAGRRDLLSDGAIAKYDEIQDACDTARRYLDALVVAADETFRKARLAAFQNARSAPHAARVGRNEPCPCGSGKKFKRCCIDSPVECAR